MIWANTYVIDTITRFTFYRSGRAPLTATVKQQNRDGTHLRTDSVVFTGIDDNFAFFDIKVVGDCVVTLDTGESRIFEFDAAANPVHDKYASSKSLEIYDEDTIDYDDPYGSGTDGVDGTDSTSTDVIDSLTPPIWSAITDEFSGKMYTISIPYIPHHAVNVSIYNADGELQRPHEKQYFWTKVHGSHNNILTLDVTLSLNYVYMKDGSSSKNLTTMKEFYVAIECERNPFTIPELLVYNRNELYGKTYGEKVIVP